MDAFLGEVRILGFNFAPQGWALCNGATLPVQQNGALFSVIGTYFGGNGQSTFCLPNFQGSTPVGVGSGPSLTPRVLGEAVGSRAVTLNAAEAPSHTHTLQVFEERSITTTVDTPSATVAVSRLVQNAGGSVTNINTFLSAGSPNALMNPASISVLGGNQPHDNTQPWLAMNFCICMSGEYPSRS